MNSQPPGARPARAAPATISVETLLPLSLVELEAALATLYRSAVRGVPRAELLRQLCGKLGALLRVPLLTLSRRDPSGAVINEATSAESALWLELQRIPQRWDSGLSSHGPAGSALAGAAPLRMGADDEGFALWRAAAAQENIRHIVALPLDGPRGGCVLEMFCREPLAAPAADGFASLRRFIQELAALLADFEAIAQRRLIARALESAGNAAFITDLEGAIAWSNAAFSALSGHANEDVRGRNPSILKSGRQGGRYYRDLWGTIRAGRVWSGETVERARDGRLYTVRQTVSPVAAEDGRITHYLAVHQDISSAAAQRRRRP